MNQLHSHTQMIERALRAPGWSDVTWRDGENGPEAVIGRFRVVNDQEMVFAGDEGTLVASVVGAAEYGNERVYFGLVADGCDAPDEIRNLDDVESID